MMYIPWIFLTLALCLTKNILVFSMRAVPDINVASPAAEGVRYEEKISPISSTATIDFPDLLNDDAYTTYISAPLYRSKETFGTYPEGKSDFAMITGKQIPSDVQFGAFLDNSGKVEQLYPSPNVYEFDLSDKHLFNFNNEIATKLWNIKTDGENRDFAQFMDKAFRLHEDDVVRRYTEIKETYAEGERHPDPIFYVWMYHNLKKKGYDGFVTEGSDSSAREVILFVQPERPIRHVSQRPVVGLRRNHRGTQEPLSARRSRPGLGFRVNALGLSPNPVSNPSSPALGASALTDATNFGSASPATSFRNLDNDSGKDGSPPKYRKGEARRLLW